MQRSDQLDGRSKLEVCVNHLGVFDVSVMRDYPLYKSPSKNGTWEFGTSRPNVDMSDSLSRFHLAGE